jgi:hypothetical protein
MEMEFFECDENASGFKLLGLPFNEDVRDSYPEHTSLLQMVNDDELGMKFQDSSTLNILMKNSDLKFGNWKKIKAFLH